MAMASPLRAYEKGEAPPGLLTREQLALFGRRPGGPPHALVQHGRGHPADLFSLAEATPRLWPHQVEAIEVCLAQHRLARSRTLVQVPCGCGKTEIAILVGLWWIHSRPFGRVLIVVPTETILAQYYRRLCALTRISIAIEKAERHAPQGARLVLASQNSLWGRLDRYPPEVLVQYDECHHKNLDAECNLQIADRSDHVVGLSGSPWSAGCKKLFTQPKCVTLTIGKAQKDALLAPHRITSWDLPPQGPWGIVFCESVEEAQELSGQHPGSTWVSVHSGHVPERIAAWRAQKYHTIYVVNMMIEGTDEPRCSRIWVRKNSKSDIRNMQIGGRPLRYRPGKTALIHCAEPEIEARMAAAFDRANRPLLTAV